MSSSLRQSILLSQNLLHNSRLVASLLDRFDLDADCVVYEIGPGKGIITEQLARRFRRVVAIEKDPRLSDGLRRRFSDCPNVTIHTGDFLRVHLPRSPYSVFANIPFNITSAIVTKLIEAERPPDEAYLTMQREAAEMYLGHPHQSLRTILIKPWFETDMVHRFCRTDFMPAPRVDVVMLRLRKRGPPLVSSADRQCFRDFVVYAFTHWQPAQGKPFPGVFTQRQLRYIARELGIKPESTPTSLSLEQWLNVFNYLKTVGDSRTLRAISGSAMGLMRQQKRLQKIHRTRTVAHKNFKTD